MELATGSSCTDAAFARRLDAAAMQQWSSPALSVQHKRRRDPLELAGSGAAMELSPVAPDAPATIEAAALDAPMVLVGPLEAIMQQPGASMELSPTAPGAMVQCSPTGYKLLCYSLVLQWSSRRKLPVMRCRGRWRLWCFAGDGCNAFAAATSMGIEAGTVDAVREGG
ncbi:hypothetical protein ZWY2020_044395 [Hordeum vulgare]|nr:hypothetical protein ZWY2020_044395 [Hordeum vulgare]